MARRKGSPKTGGRIKGTPNKVPSKLLFRQEFEKRGIDIVQSIIDDMLTQAPFQRVDAWIALLPYLYPRLGPADNVTEIGQANFIVIEKRDGSETVLKMERDVEAIE